MPEDIVPKPTRKEIIIRLLKIGVSGIPVVGGPAAEAYDYFLVSPYTKRRQEFLYRFALKQEELESKLSFDFDSALEREKVKDTIAQGYLIWLRSHEEGKKEALLNAIMNSMISDDAAEDLEMIFLHYIDFLTSSHMEMLEFLRTNEIDRKGGNWPTSLDEKIHTAIAAVNGKFSDISFFNIIIKDLIDRQLIDRMTKNVPQETYFGSVLTPMGERFLNYIKFPKTALS